MKVAHLTSAHPPYDIRIFHKECVSLANAGHSVSLVCAGANNETKEGVNIVGVPKAKTRKERVLATTKLVLEKALELDADICHLHDPELLRIAGQLVKSGKKVIYDAHEHLPEVIQSRPYLNTAFRKLTGYAIGSYEKSKVAKLHAVIGATEHITQRLANAGMLSATVRNFPRLSEFQKMPSGTQKTDVCYIGGLTKERGIDKLVAAMERVEGTTLSIAGSFDSLDFLAEIKQIPAYKKVKDYGYVERKTLHKIMANSFAGLVTILPYPNHLNSLPIKLFEYMGAGLPFIASDFPVWRELMEGKECGLFINPESVDEIANAIAFLENNPEKAAEMGNNGKQLVAEKYNWEAEEKKLLKLYEKVAGLL